MENIKLENKNVSLIKVELNNHGDYISVSPDDASFFDKFIEYTKEIMALSESVQNASKEVKITEESTESILNGTSELSKLRVQYSKDSVKLTNELFGEGTIEKYFKDIYDEIPDFVPDEECIIDFLTQMTSVVETVFNKKVGLKASLNTKSMKKYEPQDFNKKKSK